MSNSGEPPLERPVESSEAPENQAPPQGRYRMTWIRWSWMREDMLKRSSLSLRVVALVVSLLSFIIMATNKHGDWKNFDLYEEYRFLTAIAILSSLYSGVQTWRQARELSTGRSPPSRYNLALVDFTCDQILAYLLMSSSSAGVPLTNRMRENADNIFTDSSASAISMSFVAFFSTALSSLVSGHKLVNK